MCLPAGLIRSEAGKWNFKLARRRRRPHSQKEMELDILPSAIGPRRVGSLLQKRKPPKGRCAGPIAELPPEWRRTDEQFKRILHEAGLIERSWPMVTGGSKLDIRGKANQRTAGVRVRRGA